MSTTTVEEVVLPSDTRTREPRGYIAFYSLASFGLFLAILTPLLGGLSVKIQSLVGLQDAPVQLGLITGISSLFALVTQPLVGRLSDRTVRRFGMRRPWVLVGVIGAGIAFVVCGFAPNIPTLLIAFCAAQVFSNFAQAAETATVADQVPSVRRGVVSGIVGACTPLAILVGAVGLSVLPTDELRWVVPAVIATVLGLLFVFTLKDRVLAQKPATAFTFKEFIGSFYFNPRTHKNFGWAWLSKAMIMFGYGSVSSYLTLFLAADFGMNVQEQLAFNLICSMASVLPLIVVSIVAGRLSDRWNNRRAFVRLGGVLLGIGVLVIASSSMVHATSVILVGELILGIGAGLFFAVDNALCIDVLPNKVDTAKDLGVLNIANTLPTMVAPFIAGVLVIPLGETVFPGFGYPLWFMIGAIVAVVGGLIVYKVKGVK